MRMASRADMLKGSMARGGIKGKQVDPKAPTKKEATRKASAQKAGESVAKAKGTTEPKKYGEGDKKVIRDNKANVSEAQLKASGLSLRAYMNQWKKTGKRPGKKA
jgi:hypothetical protein